MENGCVKWDFGTPIEATTWHDVVPAPVSYLKVTALPITD